MPQQITTRAANKNRHPGAPDLPTARRSSKVVQEERTTLAAAAAVARKERQKNIRLTADIEDQLQSQIKTQCTNFQNPTSATAKTSKPLPVPMLVSDHTIGRAPTFQHVPARAGGDGESQGAETEKASDTKAESTNGRVVYSTEPASDVANSGSEDEVSDAGMTKRPAKVTRKLIQAARVGSRKHGNKSEAAVASIHPGKRKLKRKGATFLGPSAPKKVKLQNPSGLTDRYQRGRKEGKPADSQQECHTEGETRERKSHGGDQLEGGVSFKFGGLADEQEKTWQAAKTQSAAGPISVTKIVANAPQERLHHSAPISTATTTKSRPSHQSLPEGSAAQFMKIFIPLLRLYCGTLENPWMLPDRFVDKLQDLWDHVMLDWPHWFDEDDSIYRLCMQKIYEWRAHLGKTGIDAIEEMWGTDLKYENMDERQAYVKFALGPSLPFMYGKVEFLGADHYKASKSFRSQLVLQTFASHLRDVAAVDNDTYHKLIGNAMPKGALVLAVTSVERALTMYSTGVKEVPGKRSEASFSDIVWGTKTLWYTRSISRIGEAKFGEIINGAREYCNAAVRSRQAQVSQHVSAADDTDMLDDRALITVSSDIEAESDSHDEAPGRARA
ncbi:hypothetical protein HD554DRAFT_2266893 [Boletus coccyginus]|nr:hypothetical protein HD554DRAFT_2266893 [Boletus coccyginus]